jgi:Leucine-rich repeat (LRR) protein
LSYNNLFTLPAEVSQLLNLRTLLLINNSLQELPMSMGKLFRMEKLAVEGNPLRSPPQDVLDKGAPSIITYMRDRMPGTFNRMR